MGLKGFLTNINGFLSFKKIFTDIFMAFQNRKTQVASLRHDTQHNDI
jgi:hypothetical protein